MGVMSLSASALMEMTGQPRLCLIFCAAHTISEVRPERESIRTMLPRTVSCQNAGSAM